MIVILDHNGVPVGLFALETGDRVKEFTDNEDALLLTSFLLITIDKEKDSLKVIVIIRRVCKTLFSNKNEVVLAVNERNIPAQNLYAKVGFKIKVLEEWDNWPTNNNAFTYNEIMR